ncbi:MAG TPA: hypothetical protein VLH75_12480 [Longimicrobiales bacterium]|nr:hypothetical protein [Longimicrobiales bacterium]
MTRMALAALGMLLLVAAAAAGQTTSPLLFEVPFKFKVASQDFAAGEYRVSVNDEGQILFHAIATGREAAFPVAGTLDPPAEPGEIPRLVFSIVGNFAPSYSEYVTEYVLTEAWLGGDSGLLIRAFRGTYKTQIVTGRKAEG